MAKPTKMALPGVIPHHVVSGQPMDAVYYVPALQPKLAGTWRREPDKLAWIDPSTGLQCIIRRAEKGFLCGYVAVDLDHPLFGFRADAVPAGFISVHGGLNYAAPCDEQAPEEFSICHVSDPLPVQGGGSKDQWWFGFSCNQTADMIPGDEAHAEKAEQLAIDQEYRDEQFLFHQCSKLAAQLANAASGMSDLSTMCTKPERKVEDRP